MSLTAMNLKRRKESAVVSIAMPFFSYFTYVNIESAPWRWQKGVVVDRKVGQSKDCVDE